MHFYKTILVTIFTLSFAFVYAEDKSLKLAKVMQAYHQYNLFDGAVLVAEEGKIIYQDAFGLANREWNIPNRVDTKFMIGSISKPITATAILILVQKGLIRLDNTIEDYLPEFKNKPSAKITIRQLLTHTSGMPNYDIINDFFPRLSRQNFTREEYVKVYNDSALAFQPTTRYLYSSWGYFTLGYILEKVTGKSYEQVLKEEIFDKLNMNHSGSYSHTKIVPNRASGYDYGIGEYISADFRDQSNTMGTGDIYTTVGDLFKFHLALTDHILLNKELTMEMFTPGIPPARYGFGWFNQNFKYTATDSVKANYHLGSTEGFISFYLRIPETNSMVVILCNSAPTDFFRITKDLLKVLYNKPLELKEPAHKVMEDYIAKYNATRAVEEYQKMKLDTTHYYVDWLQMYFLGEKLLKLKRYEDARIIAEKNVLEFPERDFVALSLANIYLALNRKEDAILFYKKVLQLNPESEEAKNRLNELHANKK
jgi:CubicO group peptidase (beta-lactamase class C family)